MFRILVDSGANLPAESAEQYGIEVLSFVNYVEGKNVTCYVPGLTPEEERARGKEFYDSMRNGLTVKTGLISIGEFAEAFRKVAAAGEDVLCLTISSGISGTFNSCRIARDMVAEEFPERRIRVIDTKNASLATGILAIYAAELREQGKDVDEVTDTIEKRVPMMNGIFTVADLKYLCRTGRISKTSALIGNTLSIRPILRGDKDGHIVQYRKCHGRRSALNALISLVCDNVVNPEEQILGIAHADAYEESLYVMERITEKIKVRGFINTTYDTCTGSHVGPDTIALFFVGRDRELTGALSGVGRSILNRTGEKLDRILSPEHVAMQKNIQ